MRSILRTLASIVPLPGAAPGSRASAMALGTALVAVVASAALPRPAEAQSLRELLDVIRQGGGWIAVPVEEGRGSVQSGSVPTGGLRMEGCARVWSGHSGSWSIRAEDEISDRVLEATLGPGEAITFDHDSRSRARVRLDVRWSEPRDTTLLLWVGLGGGSDDRDPCVPVP